MKKSILRRLLFGSILITLLSFVIAGGYSYSILTNNVIEEKVAALKSNVPRISELSSVAMTTSSLPITMFYRSAIESIASNTESSVIIFNKDGDIFAAAGTNRNNFSGKKISKDLTQQVLSGKGYRRTGVMDEFFDEKTLTVGAPMFDNGKVIGGVIFNLPMPRIRSMNIRIFKSFFTMWILALCFSVILYYFISKKITTPIKKMNVAVSEFTRGNFANRVEYDSDDEIGELAANFNNMAVSIENLENMRSSFVANVSHELRTPMTTISGFIEGILDGTVKEEEREKYLHIVLDETKRLSRLVNDLLSISRMENDAYKLNKRIFNINELVKTVLFKFENSITEKNIDIDLDFSEELKDVYADSDAITQVVTNLFHNAVKFTPEGGSIALRTWVYGKKAYVEVKNTGRGIEKDKIKFVFDRFYKTDDSRSGDNTGTGLGLFIVKNLINQHGEKIWAESETDEFTKFTFSLSLA